MTTAIGVASAAFAIPAAAADVTLKIAHVLPDGDPRDQGADKIVELVEADGRCDVDGQVFPSGQLGMFNDINEGVQFGSIEMSVMPASYIVGTEPLFGIFDFPFFWPAEVDALLELHRSPAMAELATEMEKHNMVMLDVWHTGYKQWTGNKPLNELNAYDGLVSRVMPSPVLAEQQKAFGLNPVTMPFPETYSALQSGAIDAQENPIPTSWNMKFHEVQSHVTMTYHGNLDQVILVNKPWWEGLSEGCKSAIMDAMPEANKVTLDQTMMQEENAMADFAAQGVEIVEVTAEQRDAMRDAVLPPVLDFYLANNGERGAELLEMFQSQMGGS
ncbi:DctP family TRAP transporter solute-binding subunit [Alphaproteobacteria bacterium GH1-50]|uniref:DctP family TRAP transporter solute-binding subunit n=2 Tax=Kangsaoukella pontilimi TaxID=2691042 RepID=A0A7C9MFJ0_9RHOB|nr:DctP family TRAP transporter solute-binding subunit [Kangsaoukella pontilimi]